MAATVFLFCPVCRFVVERLTDPDAISNTTRPAAQPCPKCQRAEASKAQKNIPTRADFSH